MIRKIMSMANNKMRLGNALLLIFFLLPAVTKTQLSAGMQDAWAGQKSVLLTPANSDCENSVFILDRRTHSSSLDGLFKDTLILGQFRFDITKESSPSLTEFTASFIHRADHSEIPIRASPLPLQI